MDRNSEVDPCSSDSEACCSDDCDQAVVMTTPRAELVWCDKDVDQQAKLAFTGSSGRKVEW